MIWTRLFQIFFIGSVTFMTVYAARVLWQDWRDSR